MHELTYDPLHRLPSQNQATRTFFLAKVGAFFFHLAVYSCESELGLQDNANCVVTDGREFEFVWLLV